MVFFRSVFVWYLAIIWSSSVRSGETREHSNNIADVHSEIVQLPGHKVENYFSLPRPFTYLKNDDLPLSFNWGNVNGISYLTRSLNQHLPHYCGSCWAHGALSSLADRIKIARNGTGEDINLNIQYILNCGQDIAGSCLGGSHTGVYEFIHNHSGFVPYDTCQPYLACSSNSHYGFCPVVDTSCTSYNTCRTCDMVLSPSFRHPLKVECSDIDIFPNATIAEYGTYQHNTKEEGEDDIDRNVVHQIKAEIFARGPVAAQVNGKALHTYRGGIFQNKSASKIPTHIVSLVGWGQTTSDVDDPPVEYWVARNSWGQFWGEMGYFRIGRIGSNILGIEGKVAWATPGQFTVVNHPCSADGKNCIINSNYNRGSVSATRRYFDPSRDAATSRRQLKTSIIPNP